MGGYDFSDISTISTRFLSSSLGYQGVKQWKWRGLKNLCVHSFDFGVTRKRGKKLPRAAVILSRLEAFI